MGGGDGFILAQERSRNIKRCIKIDAQEEVNGLDSLCGHTWMWVCFSPQEDPHALPIGGMMLQTKGTAGVQWNINLHNVKLVEGEK